ncbi:MAG: penicillin-insensitive murein endopeptidase [Deferrisomatales bacterium]
MKTRAVRRAALALALGSAAAAGGGDWADVPGPAPGPARVFGGYDRGCLAGAVALPPEGPGFQVMRPSRNRAYGHPRLAAFVAWLGAQELARGRPGLLVGDLAQPRGGPMASGHASHQVGLDADVWFAPAPGRTLTPEEREERSAVSVVAPDGRGVNSAWTPGHAALLRTAAGHPEVARLFVNPAIKRELCRTAGPDREWLAKVRPWWGHDHHFHVRLACPPDDPDCRSQGPPEGDGCDDTLEWWFTAAAKAELEALKKRPARRLTLADLPPACGEVLAAP